MIDSIIEITTNLFQGFMFIGFLFLFFNNKKSNPKSIIAFMLFSIIFFLSINLFSNEMFYKYRVDSLVYIAIMEIYTIIFCKGNLPIRIIMPVITFLVNTVLSYGVGYTISYLSGYSIKELAINSSAYRLLCIIVINLTNLFVYYLMVKIRSKKLKLNRWTDILTFIVIPVIAMTIIYSTFHVLHLADYKKELLVYLIAISLGIAVICIISCIMLDRISESNEIKTQLLLTMQREEMYKSNALRVNEQIDKISKIKHDMKNTLQCIHELMTAEKYDEAARLCQTSTEDLHGAFTPIHTDNVYLNAIVNVELEKASSNNIDMRANISETLSEHILPTDIVSIIGNMCDNAIEYLSDCPESLRKMELSISKRANYDVIMCSNCLCVSILNSNEELTTTKSDTKMHGNGISIIRDKTNKLNGYMTISEENDCFIITAFIPRQSFPEN